MDNKLLVGLIKIGQQQSSATKSTNDAIEQLLDYFTTCPNDRMIYRAKNMVITGHSDAVCLSISKSWSRYRAHILLSEDVPVPNINGPVLTISQIIKFVMSSAAKAELAGLFICAKEMVPLHQTLVGRVWLQPKTSIQYDNSIAISVSNETTTQ